MEWPPGELDQDSILALRARAFNKIIQLGPQLCSCFIETIRYNALRFFEEAAL
jgi:hypothetical protein